MTYLIGTYNEEDEPAISGKTIPVVGILTDKTTPEDFKRAVELASGKIGFTLAEARRLIGQPVRVVTDQLPDTLPVGMAGEVIGLLHYRPERGYIVGVAWDNGADDPSLHWFNRREFYTWLEKVPRDDEGSPG